jgi:hypothetical protein
MSTLIICPKCRCTDTVPDYPPREVDYCSRCLYPIPRHSSGVEELKRMFNI